ncbi:MAG: DinB family protein [Acidobacteriales bacterium]|nr:DinB family protein [Terriglobales bacterium]
MAIRDTLLPEFDHEMASTRKVLERVPDDKLTWKPHEKSGTMGWLAAHVATLPEWVTMTFEKDSLELDPNFRPPKPGSRKEMLEAFDKHAAQARATLSQAEDAVFQQMWTLSSGGNTILSMPRAQVYRSMILNHLVHHRGQLTVYLRLNDVPVPGLYGPSDEK